MRKVNQDSYFVQKDFAGLKGLWAFGVMDGHGVQGHNVSQYVKVHLPQLMTKMLHGMAIDDMNRSGKRKAGAGQQGIMDGFLPPLAGPAAMR